MSQYLDKTGLTQVWNLAKNYFPTVKTISSVSGTTVNWQMDSSIVDGNIARFSIGNDGLVKLTGVTSGNLSAISIASGGTSQISLDASTVYTLSVGGASYAFTTPAHQSLSLITATSSTGTTENSSDQTDPYVVLLGGGAAKDSIRFVGSGSVAVKGNGGTVTVTGTNTAALGVSDTSNRRISTAESPDSYIEFTGGTNKITITDATGGTSHTFDVSITPSISSNVTHTSAVVTKDMIPVWSATTTSNSATGILKNGYTVDTSTLSSNSTAIPTSAAVSSAISGLSGAMHFVGVSTSTMTDGQTTNPTVSGVSSFSAGDVVVDATETEFVLGKEATPKWHKLGDANSYALNSVSITGTGALGGGGTLESSRTITHNTILTTGSSGTTYGPSANVSGANAINVPYLKLDSYGHVQEIGSYTYTGPSVGSGKLQVVANSSTTGIDTSFTADSSGNTIGLNFINGTHTTAVVTAVSGKAPTITFNHNSAGTGTDLAATNTDTTTYTNGGEYTVVTGVTITKDNLGHVTGLKETRQKIKSDGGQTSNVTTSAFVANSTSATSATASGTAIANGSLYYILREGSTNTATKIYGDAGIGVTKATGSTNNILIKHTNSISAKSSYASTATTASANGGTIKVTDIQYDAQGHITSSTDRTITLSQVNTASIQVSDASNKRINCSETSGNYLTFSGGTNQITITDATGGSGHTFDVPITIDTGMTAITDPEIIEICTL